MKEKEIGDLFREKLANSRQNVPDHLWESIQNDPSLQHFNRKQHRLKMAKYAGITAAAVAIITVAILAFLPQSKNIQTKSIDNQQITKIESPNTLVTVADDSILHNSHHLESAKPAEQQPIVENIAPSATVPATEEVKPVTHQPIREFQMENVAAVKETTPQTVVKPKENNQLHQIAQDIKATKHASNVPVIPAHEATLKTKVGVLSYSKDTSVCRNSEVVLYVENAAKVYWSTGSSANTITVYPDESTIFYANIATLQGTDTLIYIRIDVFDCELFVPTAFTPNSDGLNDEFLVHAPMGISNYECIIFDPASRILFKSNSITNGWDGTADGKKLPHGAYFYVITYRDQLNEKHIVKGQIILVR